jgi:4-hydroxymandelate oxidase
MADSRKPSSRQSPGAQAAPQSVGDYRKLAQQILPPGIWSYVSDGDSQANEDRLQSSRLMPRPLRDVRGGHTRLELFGQTFEHPLLLAPVAYQLLCHADGECGSAMAAGAQGGPMLISSLASQPIEAIVQAGNGGFGAPMAHWFQLYWQGERERSLRLLRRAEAAGCKVVVVTVDAPVKRATLALPPQVQAVNLEPTEAPPDGAGQVFGGWMAQAPTWDDLAWLRKQTALPLLVKGLLHPDDAEAALDAGCNGIVVSNHGGRVLAGAPISLDALDAIAKRVAGRVPLLFDSGVRSGRDVFVALAHGATAVLVGRPYVWGLAAQGAMGVAHVIRLLRDDLEMTMALTGCKQLSDIGAHCLAK